MYRVLRGDATQRDSGTTNIPAPVSFRQPTISRPLGGVSSLDEGRVISVVARGDGGCPCGLCRGLSAPRSCSGARGCTHQLFSRAVHYCGFGSRIRYSGLISLVVNRTSTSSGGSVAMGKVPNSTGGVLLRLTFCGVLRGFRGNGDSCLPFCVSTDFCRGLPCGPISICSRVHSVLTGRFGRLFSFISSGGGVGPILFVRTVERRGITGVTPRGIILRL